MRIAFIGFAMLLMGSLVAARTIYTRLAEDPPLERWVRVGGPTLAAVALAMVGPSQTRGVLFVVFVAAIIALDVVRIRRLRHRAKFPPVVK